MFYLVEEDEGEDDDDDDGKGDQMQQAEADNKEKSVEENEDEEEDKLTEIAQRKDFLKKYGKESRHNVISRKDNMILSPDKPTMPNGEPLSVR